MYHPDFSIDNTRYNNDIIMIIGHYKPLIFHNSTIMEATLK